MTWKERGEGGLVSTCVDYAFHKTNAGVELSASVTGTAPIVSVQFNYDGIPLGNPVAGATYKTVVPNLNFGFHVLTAAATDSTGNFATSPPRTLDVLENYLALGPAYEPAQLIDFTGSKLRNDFTGFVGFRFTTGALLDQDLSPFQMARVCNVGINGTHILKLVYAATGLDVPGAGAFLNAAGCTPNSNLTVQIPEMLVNNRYFNLLPNTSYYLVSQEVSGGDFWYDLMPVTTFSPDPTATFPFTIDGPVFSSGAGWVFTAMPNYMLNGLTLISDASANF